MKPRAAATVSGNCIGSWANAPGILQKKNAASQIGNPCSMGTHVSFIFIGVITYNPYFKGLKTSIFHGFWGVQRYGIYLRLVDFYCKCRLNIYQSQEDPDLGNLG